MINHNDRTCKFKKFLSILECDQLTDKASILKDWTKETLHKFNYSLWQEISHSFDKAFRHSVVFRWNSGTMYILLSSLNTAINSTHHKNNPGGYSILIYSILYYIDFWCYHKSPTGLLCHSFKQWSNFISDSLFSPSGSKQFHARLYHFTFWFPLGNNMIS